MLMQALFSRNYMQTIQLNYVSLGLIQGGMLHCDNENQSTHGGRPAQSSAAGR
jgi:hypothetical protein